jgi:galactosylceramidase
MPPSQNLSKPLWASEDSSEGGSGGGACTARALNENYVNGLITASCNWALVSAFYEGIRWWGAMLMNAAWPWSGEFQLNPSLWSTAHYTQFTAPGWSYLAHGSGVGYLAGGGTYTALAPQGANELTIIVEKLDRGTSACGYSHPPPNATTPELATFVLGGSFAAVTKLYVWYSNFSNPTIATDPDLLFQQQAPIVVMDGQVSLKVGVGSHKRQVAGS